MKHKKGRCGFTLVELLVVVAIISVLVALLLPALNSARDRARTLQCLGQLKSIGGALQMYAGEYNGYITLDYNPEYGWGWVAGDWPGKLGPYLGLGRTPSDGFYNVVRMMCPVARVKIEAHMPPAQLYNYHAGYAFNNVLDRDTWNMNDRRVVKPPKLDNLNPDLVYLCDGVLSFSSWYCVNGLFALDYDHDPYNYPEYRHNGGMNRFGSDYDMGNAANFLFVDGHAETVRYDERFDLRLWPY